jgi:hypothetical protein
MADKIKITISSEVAGGRSTICECIKKALKREGFNNWTVEGEEENSSRFNHTYNDRITAIKRKNPTIEIETVLAKREEKVS